MAPWTARVSHGSGAGSEAQPRSIIEPSDSGGSGSRPRAGSGFPAGTAVQLPAPRRDSRNPSVRSASYAAATVVRLTERASASSRSAGSLAATGTRPSRTSRRTPSASAR